MKKQRDQAVDELHVHHLPPISDPVDVTGRSLHKERVDTSTQGSPSLLQTR